MTIFGKIVIIGYGVCQIIYGFYVADKHGEPSGKHSGGGGVATALLGVIFLLIAMELI